MIDHIGMPVRDIARATEFYLKALAPLGYRHRHAGLGRRDRPWRGGWLRREIQSRFFWIGEGERLGGHVHVAFVASSREAVDAFYRAALAAGGKDNGPPGLRPHYHANYYGAFVLDLDGNNIEAVCHAPALK